MIHRTFSSIYMERYTVFVFVLVQAVREKIQQMFERKYFPSSHCALQIKMSLHVKFQSTSINLLSKRIFFSRIFPIDLSSSRVFLKRHVTSDLIVTDAITSRCQRLRSSWWNIITMQVVMSRRIFFNCNSKTRPSELKYTSDVFLEKFRNRKATRRFFFN